MEHREILKKGISINIKRTDGRIHSAFVSTVRADRQCATVEWFEQGETKGKEIDFAGIKEHNPGIIIIDDETPELHKLQHTSTSTNLANSKLDTETYKNKLLKPETGRESTKIGAANGIPRLNIRIPEATTSNGIPKPNNSSEEETSAAMVESDRFSDEEFNTNQFSPESTVTLSTQSNVGNKNFIELSRSRSSIKANPVVNDVQKDKVEPKNNGIARSNSRTRYSMSNGGVKETKPNKARLSNVVKDIEKIRKNRDERRQKQAEEKAEKEAFLQMAPGNPHWELLNMITEYRRGLDINPLCDNDVIEDHLITVCVRKRPLNKKELGRKEVDVITVPSKNQIIVHEPKNKVDLTKFLENQLFRFDYAFDETCSNETVYKYTAQPLIKTVFEGGFATCFAYGQTGSGKTHTMGGDFNGKTQDSHKGIYAMAAHDVFKMVNSVQYRHLQLVVSVSFFEIYSGKVFDLLNNKEKLRILENGQQQVQVVGLTEKVVTDTDEILKLIQRGNQARTSGKTFANANSSRSHAVFEIFLRSQNTFNKIHGKFSLIDLAGNERGADTSSANRQTRMEGAEINKALLALKECIRALGRKGSHLPFRASKLTLVLRDSFVGANSRTCMIAMISPGVNSCEHTLNTLRYADRVKELGGGDLQTTNAATESQSDEDIEDLQRLRSLNEHDMTPEMLNFHQVVSELQIAEENVYEFHKRVIEHYEPAKTLLRMAQEVTFDQEAYINKLSEWLRVIPEMAEQGLELVKIYKEKLAAEEALSRRTCNQK